MIPDTIQITVTPALLNVIMNALSALPFKDAAGPINELQRQIQAQVAPQRPVAVPDALPEVALPVGKSG